MSTLQSTSTSRGGFPPLALRYARPLLSGQNIGNYRIVDRFASGGMGHLYDVIDVPLARPAVLKVLHDRHRGRADFAARLRDEARLLARLPAGDAPAVFASGELEDGRPYFVMEKLFGHDLCTELSRLGVLSVPSAIRIVSSALLALSRVHVRGIVHRDIKPANLFLANDGRVTLLDFGVACMADSDLSRTAKNATVGTLRHMSPEQTQTSRVDERSDLYAMGLVLYELLTGRGAFDHVEIPVLMRRGLRGKPLRPSQIAPQQIPSRLDEVVLRSLAERPEHRFHSARAMGQALVASISEIGDDEPTLVDAWAV